MTTAVNILNPISFYNRYCSPHPGPNLSDPYDRYSRTMYITKLPRLNGKASPHNKVRTFACRTKCAFQYIQYLHNDLTALHENVLRELNTVITVRMGI